jgi:hypothetical protein
MSVLFILLSLITGYRSCYCFFQAYLEGFAWLGTNFWIVQAVVFGSIVWILLLALISQTV